MASPDWLRAHRELQYLRAAMWECQGGSRAHRRRRRRYADLRWRKLHAVNPRFRNKRRPGKRTRRQEDNPELS
jgi:hypothetical protein